MKIIKTLALGAGLSGLLFSAAYADGLQGKVIGFSQIGSESGWRAAETTVTKAVPPKLGIDLKFADAQQKQENQIKAIRGFIAQGVDAILVAPVVATGWEEVLTEAKEANIPVVLLDRGIDGPEDLYLTSVASDQVKEGRVAGEWLVGTVGDKQCKVVELQGTVGSSPAINRKQGFEEALAGKANLCHHPQPDRRLHPLEGQGSHGRLPQGRRRRQEHLRRLRPQRRHGRRRDPGDQGCGPEAGHAISSSCRSTRCRISSRPWWPVRPTPRSS